MFLDPVNPAFIAQLGQYRAFALYLRVLAALCRSQWRFRVSLLPSVPAEHVWEHNVTRTANLPYLLLSISLPHHTPTRPHTHTRTLTHTRPHTPLVLQEKQPPGVGVWCVLNAVFILSLLNWPICICCVFVLSGCITVVTYTVITIYAWRPSWDLSPCRGRCNCLGAELSDRCLVLRMSDKPWFNRSV